MNTKTLIHSIVLSAGLLLPYLATAEQQEVVLELKNMTCSSCYYIVNKSLRKVDGVIDVAFPSAGIARVTYDDGVCDLVDLVEATGAVGFPAMVGTKLD